jgi:hypothetical protein
LFLTLDWIKLIAPSAGKLESLEAIRLSGLVIEELGYLKF